MQKIPFQDLPNTTTPVDADNLNQLQTNVETDLGLLSNLNTTSKTNLVSAINETNSKVVNDYTQSSTMCYSAGFVNDYVADKVSDVYSTTETQTNKFWTDGKPIYRKVFPVQAISSTGVDTWVDMGVAPSTISQILKIDGIYNISIGSLPVNFYNPANNTYSVLTYYNTQSTNARLGIRNNIAITGGFIIIEYTKPSS